MNEMPASNTDVLLNSASALSTPSFVIGIVISIAILVLFGFHYAECIKEERRERNKGGR